jgi:tetratricopeptide (TPR) repeat protein
MQYSKKSSGRFIFKMIAIILPFAILALVEMGLRLFNYGSDLRIFLEDKDRPGFLYLNPEVAKRYFTVSQNATYGNKEVFCKKKGGNTFRAFVLGASTAIGFPYYHNGSFARMLQYRLQRTFPDKNFEIINLSLTAINSYALLDFAKAASLYQPDAIIFYEGHNEYYGVLGVGSTNSVGRNPAVIQTMIRLKSLRVVQLLFNISSRFQKNSEMITNQHENLMRRMSAEKTIIYRSELYEAGVGQFRRNIDQILQTFSQKGIPVFLSTIVSNEKDLKPMMSVHKDSLTISASWNTRFKAAEKAMRRGDTAFARKLFRELNREDSSYALTHYYLGNLAYANGEFYLAKRYFMNARELDALRFRGPAKMNEVILLAAAKYKNVILVDVLKTFEDYSPHHIIGSELILEHLHPNLRGNFLMSDAFYRAFKQSNILSAPWRNEIPFEEMYRELPLTKVDSLYGLYGTLRLKAGWPFYEAEPAGAESGSALEGKLANALLNREMSWNEAFDSLYHCYLEKKNYVGALKLTEGLILEFPNKTNFYEFAIGLANELNNPELSAYYSLRLFRISPDFNLAKMLFIHYLKKDEPGKALPFIDFAISNNSSAVKFEPMRAAVMEIISLQQQFSTDSLNVNTSNKIADRYFLLGNYGAASQYIEKTLKLQLNNKEALLLKSKMAKTRT